MSWRICIDCGVDTAPAAPRRGRWEYYMVRNDVWQAAGMARDTPAKGSGSLCIGCLESRLGRELQASDFTDVTVNFPAHPYHTPRLASRLCRGLKS